MAVNYEYYRCFYYVAKYRNLTRAASAMMSSQPNVTRVMNNLEHELGCRLITRSNRGITLTEEGERLYQHVAVAIEHLQQGEELLTHSGNQGSVYIGASETALHGLLLDVLRKFHQAYPSIRLKIRNCTALGGLQAVRSRQIDFAVVTMAAGPLQRPFRRTDLKPLRDVLVGGRPFAELADQTLCLADLKRYPMIGLDQDTAAFSFYNDFFMEHGLEFDPDMEVSTTGLLLPMIENDLGLGFVPEEFVRESLRDGRVVQLRLKETIPERYICLVQDDHGSLSAAAKTLKQMLCTQFIQKQEKICENFS